MSENLSLQTAKLFSLNVIMTIMGLSISACASKKMRASKTTFERCAQTGWQQDEFEVLGHKRRLLYKAPKEDWDHGAILVLHGGGGKPEDFCDDSVRLLLPQVGFTEMALEQKFAVFLLDSTNVVTDNNGKLCGKIWDDEVRQRPNLDLPYLKHIIQNVIPSKRPKNSATSIFMAGHSSGGYMTVRAASHMGNLMTAFVGIASGNPYGWTRNCDTKAGDKRENVFGGGFDNETGKEIIEKNSCLSDRMTHEKTWDQYEGPKPVFRIFHNEFDGINDVSCSSKVDKQLRKNGFVGEPSYKAQRHDGRRRLIYHFWSNEYNSEILAFFKKQISKPK